MVKKIPGLRTRTTSGILSSTRDHNQTPSRRAAPFTLAIRPRNIFCAPSVNYMWRVIYCQCLSSPFCILQAIWFCVTSTSKKASSLWRRGTVGCFLLFAGPAPSNCKRWTPACQEQATKLRGHLRWFFVWFLYCDMQSRHFVFYTGDVDNILHHKLKSEKVTILRKAAFTIHGHLQHAGLDGAGSTAFSIKIYLIPDDPLIKTEFSSDNGRASVY